MDNKWQLLKAREKAEILVNGFENTENTFTHLRDSEPWQKFRT
jgi:hypothetical protein